MKGAVQEYYGKVLRGSSDLKTNACCTDEALPDYVKPILGQVHDEVLSRYYGCGLVLPEALEGLTVLDLGCGAGRDVYLLSGLVGERGRVIGVDMTEEQLDVARRHQEFHRIAFGYEKSNVSFLSGDIESLDALHLPDGCVDVVVSNCVVNLVVNKSRVFEEVFRVLKPGGEMYFSDVYADRRIPEDLYKDPVLYGECLSGALYWNDFLRIVRENGFVDPRLVSDRPLSIGDSGVIARTGHIGFFSATYRLFKLQGLESACEDYGQTILYRGTLPNLPHSFRLDRHHHFETGRHLPVCGNTWRILHDTRFRDHFEFSGDFSRHFGIFPGCGTSIPFDTTGNRPDKMAGTCC